MSSSRVLVILCHVALIICGVAGAPTGRKQTIISVKCGERPVAHATVHFIEYEKELSTYKSSNHNKIDLNHKTLTDEHGHYHFKNDEVLGDLSTKYIRVQVKDSCLVETVQTKCNLPYNIFEVTLAEIPSISPHQLLLDLTQWDFTSSCI
ncbi:hypothetical protein CRE_16459 [Caenorhabditis remanei]|uniref:Uncharacterized protein n=1 Tax=Caenorhabditis remanei TaxID=31234 RepID=E3NHC4_CAERE|nr:hypothetical protein CRE_16459 [Caenorhabditis remanei]